MGGCRVHNKARCVSGSTVMWNVIAILMGLCVVAIFWMDRTFMEYIRMAGTLKLVVRKGK